MAGGRFEHHKLTPKPDEIYLANEAAAPATGALYKNFSPKLAAIWSMDGGYVLSGQYSQGFRAPPYSDVNIGFANTQAGYTSVANPYLRPEKSEGVELVWQRKLATGSWSVAAFDNRYRDFIENQMLNCPGDAACSDLVPLTFQSLNVSRVRIVGGELKFESMLPAQFVLRGALAYARGRKTDEGKPLDSVNPISGTLGLQQTIGAVKWELSTTFAQRKKAQDAEKQEASDQLKRQFLTPGYAVADLRVIWRYAKDSTLGIGVHNLFDRLYYHWSDVPVADIHVPDSQAGAERYSQPGRQYTISVQHAF
jgi:hemoglobin/transferrin/lactoferrin receptor protein